MPQLILGAYLNAPRAGHLAHSPYGQLEQADLAEFLRHWNGLHRQALSGVRDRIHPTAQIHPSALIGEDVIIGPHARVYEFSTVRDASVLCAGARVGFNCEVTRCRIASGVTLAGRTVPADSTITAPHTADIQIRRAPARQHQRTATRPT